MLNFLMIVIEQSLIYLPLALGAYMSLSLLKVPDLSLETAYLMGAFFGATALSYVVEYSLWIGFMVTMFASICGGALVGLTSSFITSYGKVPHLLSAIITFGLFNGIFQYFSSSYQSLAGYENVLMLFSYGKQYPEIGGLIIGCTFVFILYIYLLSTQLGYSFAIFGFNPLFFKHFNISTPYVFITGIIIANGLAGFSGFLFAQTSNFIELNMGIGKSLFYITTLILGRSVIYHTKISIGIPVAGVFLYFLIQQVLLQIGFNLQYFTMIQSLLILLILLTIYKKDRSLPLHDQLGV